MQKKCSKCEAETNYDDDLHCRKIFLSEINSLVILNEVEKAKILFISSPFDEKWKELLLWNLGKVSVTGKEIENQVRKEMQQKDNERSRIETEKLHRKYLGHLGIEHSKLALNVTTNRHRVAHCHNCKGHLDNSIHIECFKCEWIICECGACGCG